MSSILQITGILGTKPDGVCIVIKDTIFNTRRYLTRKTQILNLCTGCLLTASVPLTFHLLMLFINGVSYANVNFTLSAIRERWHSITESKEGFTQHNSIEGPQVLQIIILLLSFLPPFSDPNEGTTHTLIFTSAPPFLSQPVPFTVQLHPLSVSDIGTYMIVGNIADDWIPQFQLPVSIQLEVVNGPPEFVSGLSNQTQIASIFGYYTLPNIIDLESPFSDPITIVLKKVFKKILKIIFHQAILKIRELRLPEKQGSQVFLNSCSSRQIHIPSNSWALNLMQELMILRLFCQIRQVQQNYILVFQLKSSLFLKRKDIWRCF